MVAGACAADRTGRALRLYLEPILELLDNPTVEDIFANPDGKVWVRQRGVNLYHYATMQAGDIQNIIHLVASHNNTVCNVDKPILEAILPFRSARFEGVIPPVTVAPSFSIRLRPQEVYLLADYIEAGIITAQQAYVIGAAIKGNRNILIVGGTGTGKTTMLNACLAHVSQACPLDRIVSIEDTAELQCSSPNYVGLLSSGTVTMTACVRAALRLCPTRIVVGEVRGGEALDMLKAWNTGHPGGFATVHANTAAEGLERIEALAREATGAPQQRFIAATVNVVVFLSRTVEHPFRKVLQILRITGYKNGEYVFEDAEEAL